MTHFFVPDGIGVDGLFHITGGDLNHMKNVLRMKPGDPVVISDGSDRDHYCRILSIDKEEARLTPESEKNSSELPAEIVLYQGLPKADKMELIIQKAVELGASRIVPVDMKRCVVRLDEKKIQSKTARWNQIARSAAEQSGRSRIPEVSAVMRYRDAVLELEKGLFLLPYENARGMAATKDALREVTAGKQIGILIGPEGGFESAEVDLAMAHGATVVSLGRRILRTETAGLAAITMCMLELEFKEIEDET